MQLCVYSELLTDLQGTRPADMHLFLGDHEKQAPRRFEWNSPGNLCQITRKIRNEEPEWTATRYCSLGWV